MLDKREASNESIREKKKMFKDLADLPQGKTGLESACDKHNLIYARYTFSTESLRKI